jgi:hypothetical protein
MDCYRYAAEKAKAASISSATSASLPSAVVLNFSTAFLPEAEDTVQTCVKCVTWMCQASRHSCCCRFISLFAQDDSDVNSRDKLDIISSASLAPRSSSSSSSSAAAVAAAAAEPKPHRTSLSRASSDLIASQKSSRATAAMAKLTETIGGCLKVPAIATLMATTMITIIIGVHEQRISMRALATLHSIAGLF